MKPSEPSIWITGAGGLIGHCLMQTCPAHFNAIGILRKDLDLMDTGEVEKRFRTDQPSGIIHCAAISKSPVCQKNPTLAHQTNVEATHQLAQLAESIPFIFLSSDLVFDGKQGHYIEPDPPNPLSIYGETKAKAEEMVLRNPQHTVIRTSLNGGQSPTGDRGFNEELHRVLRNGQTMNLFTDEYRSPMAAKITARASWELLAAKSSGVFHIAGAERLSRYDIGRLLTERWGEPNERILAGSLKDYNGPPRAPDTSLCCDKVSQILSFPLPSFSQWLKDHPEESF